MMKSRERCDFELYFIHLDDTTAFCMGYAYRVELARNLGSDNVGIMIRSRQ